MCTPPPPPLIFPPCATAERWSRNEQKKSKQILCIAPALKPQIEKAARFVIENSMGVRAHIPPMHFYFCICFSILRRERNVFASACDTRCE